jgi:cell wall-associated NlpC family hydrolase
MRISRPLLLVLALFASGACAALEPARVLPPAAPGTVPPHGVIGITEAHLSPEFWLEQLAFPDRVVMAPVAIRTQNSALMRLDDTLHDLEALPQTVGRKAVLDAILGLSTLRAEPLYDQAGGVMSEDTRQSLVQALAVDAIPDEVAVRYGLVLRRTALRGFPTELRVFSSKGETDIDRFQESALFPGTPVAIMHRSRDQRWVWVVSPNYQAWMLAQDLAEGGRSQVLEHARKTPYRIVTGAKVSTVFTREVPALSELQLDMGVRVPLSDVAPGAPVNGQHPYTSWAVELPVRDAQGALAFAPALLQKNQDTAADYLPLTHGNIIRQSFKFLGERYGWGHSYNARDCSGFVSEVYRSMGVELPRNTRDQSVSPALNHVTFDRTAGAAARKAAVEALEVGDLIYIPGHVMMMIGRVDGAPYVIHDTNGGSYLGDDGKLHSMRLNGVSVTPLLPLRFNQDQTYVDRITSIVRIRP